MPGEEQRRLKGLGEEIGLHEPRIDKSGRPREENEDGDFENPADLVVDHSDPRASIDPELTQSDLGIIADEFSKALVWASQAKSLVEMGWRIHAMLLVFRPVLVEGMALENRRRESDLLDAMSCSGQLLALVGDRYRNVLAWCRRCASLSQLGQRGFAMLYVMRRDLIGRLNTNAALGGLSNKTRQAFNKTVGDFRDSIHGFRNGVMRGERTRIKCRIAQTTSNK